MSSAQDLLREDYHVHSAFSDGVSTVEENLAAARRRGLRTLCLADHVRRDSAWVPEFAAAVEPLRGEPGLTVLAGVEAKILDRSGRLDLPPLPAGIDLVLIADHQFPGGQGPVAPEKIAALVQAGELGAAEVISCLVEATARALLQVPAMPLIAHLFSVLPKMGLDESQVPAAQLGWLAGQLRTAGALVEINEKWSCPSPGTARILAEAGVPLVASTDSHDCADVGVYSSVRRTLDAVADGIVR
jgi:putative hydrolase